MLAVGQRPYSTMDLATPVPRMELGQYYRIMKVVGTNLQSHIAHHRTAYHLQT